MLKKESEESETVNDKEHTGRETDREAGGTDPVLSIGCPQMR
jgi:hypothetical protein